MSDSVNKTAIQSNKETRADQTVVRILQVIMVSGLILIMLGIYFHMYNDTIEAMGVTGIVISACCVAIGMIMSLPTKMYLTFVLIKREEDRKQANRSTLRHE